MRLKPEKVFAFELLVGGLFLLPPVFNALIYNFDPSPRGLEQAKQDPFWIIMALQAAIGAPLVADGLRRRFFRRPMRPRKFETADEHG